MKWLENINPKFQDQMITSLKTNMEPDAIKKENHLPNLHFQVPAANFKGRFLEILALGSWIGAIGHISGFAPWQAGPTEQCYLNGRGFRAGNEFFFLTPKLKNPPCMKMYIPYWRMMDFPVSHVSFQGWFQILWKMFTPICGRWTHFDYLIFFQKGVGCNHQQVIL